MSKKSWSSFGIWAIIVLILWVLAWIIAEAIPLFNDLLSLISALFASWFTYGLSGVFWLYLNRGQYRSSKRKMFLTGVNVGCFCLGAVIVGFTALSCFSEKFPRIGLLTDCNYSVDSDYTRLGRRSTSTLRTRMGVFHAHIIQRDRLDA